LLTFFSFRFSCSTGLSCADSSQLDDSSLLEDFKSMVFFCLATTPEPERSFFSRRSLALIERSAAAVESTGVHTAAERFSWRALASGARTVVERFSWRALASGVWTAVERFFFSQCAPASETGSAADENLLYTSRFYRRACSERFRLSFGDPIEGGSGGLGCGGGSGGLGVWRIERGWIERGKRRDAAD
jgi:hypothetical protein